MNQYTRSFLLTAADCNAQMELPLPALAQSIVEVATDHANLLGVGHTRLLRDGNAWVLLRLTLEMERMPREGEEYVVTTWVEDFNRRFSERCFEITVRPAPLNSPPRGGATKSAEASVGESGTKEAPPLGGGMGGACIGHVRTIWTVIDSATRQSASLDGLENLLEVVNPHKLAWQRAPRVRPADFADAEPWHYTVRVSDIDSNRHLTAMRYLQLMLDSWSLDFYDTHRITRFEIAYSTEARYGDTLAIVAKELDADGSGAAGREGAAPLQSAGREGTAPLRGLLLEATRPRVAPAGVSTSPTTASADDVGRGWRRVGASPPKAGDVGRGREGTAPLQAAGREDAAALQAACLILREGTSLAQATLTFTPR